MNGKGEPTPIEPTPIEPTPFNFGEALEQLKAGLRVVDVTWGTGEWLELVDCPAVTGAIIVKYNQGSFSAYQPDSHAMLVAGYSVVK